MKEMSFWGVSPKIMVLLIPNIICFASLHFIFFPAFLLPINPIFMVVIGLVLISIGTPIYLSSVKTIKQAYFSSELVTTGIYGHMRHPLYAAFSLFIIPGIVCLFNSWILLMIPISYYLIFKLYIKEEEEYCLEKFGELYKKYKQQVHAIFPKLKKYNSELEENNP